MANLKLGDLILARPSAAYAAAFKEMVADFRSAGERYYRKDWEIIQKDFAGYLRCLEQAERGENLPPGRVAQSEFWLLHQANRQVLGAIRLRHTLTPRLEQIDGQIGYNIRPGARCQGFATQMLALLLAKMKTWGWKRVLITCNADNLASARVIEKNGGQLENQVVEPLTGKLISRYWIEILQDFSCDASYD